MSSKVYSFFLHKGGVGKTTITAAVAYEMGKSNKVLVIDSDKQGDISKLLCEKREDNKSFLNLMKELIKKFEDINTVDINDFIVTAREPSDNYTGLYLLGAEQNSNADDFNDFIAGPFQRNKWVLKKIVQMAKNAGFEYIFIDLPGALNEFEQEVLQNADEIIPIIKPEAFEVDHYQALQKFINKLTIVSDSNLKQSKCLVLNLENKSNLTHKYYMELFKNSPYNLFEFINSNAITNATSTNQLIQEYDRKNKLCETFAALADSLK